MQESILVLKHMHPRGIASLSYATESHCCSILEGRCTYPDLWVLKKGGNIEVKTLQVEKQTKLQCLYQTWKSRRCMWNAENINVNIYRQVGTARSMKGQGSCNISRKRRNWFGAMTRCNEWSAVGHTNAERIDVFNVHPTGGNWRAWNINIITLQVAKFKDN